MAALTIILDGLLDELLHFLVPGCEHTTRNLPCLRRCSESWRGANEADGEQQGSLMAVTY